MRIKNMTNWRVAELLLGASTTGITETRGLANLFCGSYRKGSGLALTTATLSLEYPPFPKWNYRAKIIHAHSLRLLEIAQKPCYKKLYPKYPNNVFVPRQTGRSGAAFTRRGGSRVYPPVAGEGQSASAAGGTNQLPPWLSVDRRAFRLPPSAFRLPPSAFRLSPQHDRPLDYLLANCRCTLCSVHTTGFDTKWPDNSNWHPGLFVGYAPPCIPMMTALPPSA